MHDLLSPGGGLEKAERKELRELWKDFRHDLRDVWQEASEDGRTDVGALADGVREAFEELTGGLESLAARIAEREKPVEEDIAPVVDPPPPANDPSRTPVPGSEPIGS